MTDEKDILERLVDFDHCGNTATERFALRMDAWSEIRQLRAIISQMEDDAFNYGVERDLATP
jgi:hypothetical protein